MRTIFLSLVSIVVGGVTIGHSTSPHATYAGIEISIGVSLLVIGGFGVLKYFDGQHNEVR